MNHSKKKYALVLGGGGSRGAYEVGVWQALKELDTPIHIITGTSVGAINGAMIAQGDLEHTIHLWQELQTHMVFDVPEGGHPLQYAKEVLLHHGAGSSGLKNLLTKYISEDLVRNSSIDYGLTTVMLPKRNGLHLFLEDIPDGKLIDYIMASASAFPAIQSYEIDGKDYIDGGYSDVLPIHMALKRGATHVIAVNLNGLGITSPKSSSALKEHPRTVVVECPWDLGNWLIFDVENTKRILRLGYLDTMKAFHVFDGHYFTFSSGAFDKTTTTLADSCGKVFSLDPTLIYTRETFLSSLAHVIDQLADQTKEAEKRYRALKSTRNGSFESLRELSKDASKELKVIPDDHILTFFIAYDIKEKGQTSGFIRRPALALFRDQILSARFLVKFGMI